MTALARPGDDDLRTHRPSVRAVWRAGHLRVLLVMVTTGSSLALATLASDRVRGVHLVTLGVGALLIGLVGWAGRLAARSDAHLFGARRRIPFRGDPYGVAEDASAGPDAEAVPRPGVEPGPPRRSPPP